MTTPLWILAAGAVVAGFLWIPRASLFEAWLAPVTAGHHGGHHEHPPWSLELGLMGVSVMVAAAGILLAWAMYYRRALRPEVFSNALGGLPYRAVLNKWYVDEIYEFVIVGGLLALCRFAAWFDGAVIDGIVNASAAVTRLVSRVSGLFDLYVVDGAVNGVATVTQFTGRRFRNFQSGAITWYVYVILLGVVGSVLLYRSLAVAS
jgi:NADH-quinone oxidoreductase subunit L